MTYQSNRAGAAVSGPVSCSFSRPMSMTFEDTTPEASADRPLGKKVLIVEDNDLNMKLFNDLLVAHGYGTLQSKDGVEALKLARQHRPDLILIDNEFPANRRALSLVRVPSANPLAAGR